MYLKRIVNSEWGIVNSILNSPFAIPNAPSIHYPLFSILNFFPRSYRFRDRLIRRRARDRRLLFALCGLADPARAADGLLIDRRPAGGVLVGDLHGFGRVGREEIGADFFG